MQASLDSEITSLVSKDHPGYKVANNLAKAGFLKVRDLFYDAPRKYIDYLYLDSRRTILEQANDENSEILEKKSKENWRAMKERKVKNPSLNKTIAIENYSKKAKQILNAEISPSLFLPVAIESLKLVRGISKSQAVTTEEDFSTFPLFHLIKSQKLSIKVFWGPMAAFMTERMQKMGKFVLAGTSFLVDKEKNEIEIFFPKFYSIYLNYDGSSQIGDYLEDAKIFFENKIKDYYLTDFSINPIGNTEVAAFIKQIVIPSLEIENIVPKRDSTLNPFSLERKEVLQELVLPRKTSDLEKYGHYLFIESCIMLEKYLRSKLKIKRSTKEKHLGDPSLKQDEKDFSKEMEELSLKMGKKLYDEQMKVLISIYSILRENGKLEALIQGEVGSGKTLVAILTSLLFIRKGGKVIFICPTVILAEQHFQAFNKLLSSLGVRSDRLVASLSEKEKNQVLERLSRKEIELLFSTSSILHSIKSITQLDLLIVDEEHKFGLEQREILKKKFDSSYLALSATPLPLTLSKIKFNVLNVLEMKRTTPILIETNILDSITEDNLVEMVLENIRKKKKTLIISHKIQDTKVQPTESLIGIEKILNRVGLIEGTDYLIVNSLIDDSEIMKKIERFKREEVSIILATSVLEVGFDVADIETMIIFAANKFGLAALHQLRGRIGRSGKKAILTLVPSTTANQSAMEKIKLFASTTDGLLLSEIDLQNRNIGDFFSEQEHEEQSGRPTYGNFLLSNFFRGKEKEKMFQEIIAQNRINFDNIDEDEKNYFGFYRKEIVPFRRFRWRR